MHYTCIALITVDSVMRMEKKNDPQVYLEECKYKIKKRQMSRFINTELDLDSESDDDYDSDNDSEMILIKILIMILSKVDSNKDKNN